MYHPETLSTMAKQNRLEIQQRMKQLRMINDDRMESREKSNFIQDLIGSIQRIAAGAENFLALHIKSNNVDVAG